MPRSGTKRSEDIEGRRKDPNLAGMLLSSSVESEPLCEMASEWTPMPKPLVVDSGAAETIIPRLWFPSHKTAESEGSKRGVFYTTADGSCVENEGEKTLIMSTVDGGQMRKWTFQVRNVNKARGSVSMIVRNGNRVVFHTSGSYTENKMMKEILWLRERDGVYVVDMMAARKRTEGHTAFREGWQEAEPVCPNEPTEEHGMWDGGRAARDGGDRH